MPARWLRLLFAALALSLAAGGSAHGAPPPPPPSPAPGANMDYGPFLTGSLDRDRAVSERDVEESTEQAGNPNALAAKAIVVRFGAGTGTGGPDSAAIAFDTDLLRYAAGWTGGFVNLDKTHLATMKGSVPLAPVGKLRFVTPPLPGWCVGDQFADPRPHPFGPLPRTVGYYKGLYLHGDDVIFSYTVGDCDILERAEFRSQPGAKKHIFSRTFHLSPSRETLSLLLCKDDRDDRARTEVGLVRVEGDSDPGVIIRRDGGLVAARVAPSDRSRNFRIAITGPLDPDRHVIVGSLGITDLSTLIHGDPPRYAKAVTTRGALGTGDGAYVVDTLTLPDDNPWKSWMRPSGLDFFSDGRLAVCTLNGDVWVVSGIDESLKELKWRRFATGLYEPLGLKIVDDRVYVLGRDQITRLHDLNNDGEADFYENFNNDAPCSANYHGFAMDLATDRAGNFYYTRAGQRMNPALPDHGALLRVSRDGSKLEPIAAGLRAANGMAIGPDDLITVGDNQGNWTPSSKINVIKKGGFYGYMPHVTAAGGSPREDYDPPLCWIPYALDNSSGSQVWTTDAGNRFGPLSNRLLHTSYGMASLMLVTIQPVDRDKTLYQGGVIPLPLKFDSGIMRGRMNPRDGQLYLCGLRGWQTAGARDGTLCRVRYTGKPLYLPTDTNVGHNEINLTFSQPLDPATAEDPGSYGVEQWNYRWSKDYGSPDYSVKDPSKQGRDEVAVASARLSPDRRTVTLSIPGLRPVMQMGIRANVDAADGTTIDHTVYLTIHHVPGAATKP